MIFVFGSNLAGRHGKGAALTARLHHGAEYGVAEGMTGNSYALPTCGHRFQPLPYTDVAGAIYRFIEFAGKDRGKRFQVTRVGCGLGRYQDADIAPLFREAPNTCLFDQAWHPWLGGTHRYWGTF